MTDNQTVRPSTFQRPLRRPCKDLFTGPETRKTDPVERWFTTDNVRINASLVDKIDLRDN